MNVSLWSYHRVRFAIGLTIATCALIGMFLFLLPHNVALVFMGIAWASSLAFSNRHQRLAKRLELDH